MQSSFRTSHEAERPAEELARVAGGHLDGDPAAVVKTALRSGGEAEAGYEHKCVPF